MSIFKKIGAFLSKVFKSVKTSGDQVAISITEGVKTALDTGIVDFLAQLMSAILPGVHDIPEEVVAAIKVAIPKVLAAELAVQGLPDNPTQDDILAFEQKVMAAFGVHDNKSKLYTTLAAQIYGIIEAHNGNSWTFAQLVIAVEKAYADYVADVAQQN
jgi:hypothetical protein